MSLKSFVNHRSPILGRGNGHVLLCSTLFLVCAFFVSWPSRAETQQIDGLNFGRVVALGSVEVEIRQGEEAQLLVRGTSSDLEKRPFFMNGTTLFLGRDRGQDYNFGPLRFKLTVVEIEHLQLTGSGKIYVKPLVVEDLYVSVDGSGEIKLFGVAGRDLTMSVAGSGDIQAAKLELSRVKMVVSGSGDLHVGEMKVTKATVSVAGSGDISVQKESEATELEVNVAGSGDVDLVLLAARKVEVNIVGSGVAQVNALDELDVSIMGSGEVMYIAAPKQISQSVLGSGSIELL